MLETVFPLAAGVFGFLREAVEVVLFELDAAEVVAGVVVVFGVEGVGGFGVGFGEGETFALAFVAGFVGIVKLGLGDQRGGFDALGPGGKLGDTGAESFIDFGIEEAFEGLAAVLAFDAVAFFFGGEVLFVVAEFGFSLACFVHPLVESDDAFGGTFVGVFEHAEFFNDLLALGGREQADGFFELLEFLAEVGEFVEAAGAFGAGGFVEFPVGAAMEESLPLVLLATQAGDLFC